MAHLFALRAQGREIMFGTFQTFSAYHLGAISATAFTLIAWKYYLKKRHYSFKSIQLALIGIVAVIELTTPIYSYFVLHLNWAASFPLHMCDFSRICLIVFLMCGSTIYAELGFFWGIGGGIIAMLTPDLHQTFPSFEFNYFFFSHLIIFIAIIYIVHHYRFYPSWRSVFRVTTIGSLLTLWFYGFNQFIGGNANYWYVNYIPKTADIFKSILPKAPLHLPIYIVLGSLLFSVIYVFFDMGYKIRSKIWHGMKNKKAY